MLSEPAESGAVFPPPPMEKTVIKLAPLTVAIAATLALTACGKKEEAKPAPTAAPATPSLTVKIGHVGPITGP